MIFTICFSNHSLTTLRVRPRKLLWRAFETNCKDLSLGAEGGASVFPADLLLSRMRGNWTCFFDVHVFPSEEVKALRNQTCEKQYFATFTFGPSNRRRSFENIWSDSTGLPMAGQGCLVFLAPCGYFWQLEVFLNFFLWHNHMLVTNKIVVGIVRSLL